LENAVVDNLGHCYLFGRKFVVIAQLTSMELLHWLVYADIYVFLSIAAGCTSRLTGH